MTSVHDLGPTPNSGMSAGFLLQSKASTAFLLDSKLSWGQRTSQNKRCLSKARSLKRMKSMDRGEMKSTDRGENQDQER